MTKRARLIYNPVSGHEQMPKNVSDILDILEQAVRSKKLGTLHPNLKVHQCHTELLPDKIKCLKKLYKVGADKITKDTCDFLVKKVDSLGKSQPECTQSF